MPIIGKVTDFLSLYEETVNLLLFHELFCCVCKMKMRTYKLASLMLKMLALFFISFIWRFIFEIIDIFMDAGEVQRSLINISVIASSGVVTLFLFYYTIRMTITLIQGCNFHEKLRGNNSFLIGLMAVTISSQLFKLSFHISRVVKDYHDKSEWEQCQDEVVLLQDFAEMFRRGLECQKRFLKGLTHAQYLSVELCSFIECIFCTVIMIYRKIAAFIATGRHH